MAPITLSKSAFLQKRPGGNYQNYLGYLARHRGSQIGASNADPLAPMSPQTINSTVNRFTGMYGAPQTDAQIQATAQGEIDPIIAAVTKTANDRATASANAIKGLTDEYARELGGIDFASPYKSAEADQAAVDAALQQSLTGAGSDLASQLKARLSPIASDPAVAQAAAGLADRGAAIGTTQLAQGSNALSSLIANAAAAGSYSQKLPVIAKFAGIQGVNQANAQAANDISSGTLSATSQLPSIVQALRGENSTLRGNRASGAANLFETLTGQNVTRATAKAGLENQNFDNGLAYANTYGYNPQTGQPTVAATKAAAAAKAAAAKAKAAKQPKPLTTSDRKSLSALADQLYNGVQPHYKGVTVKTPDGQTAVKWVPIPGTGAPPTRWPQAVAKLVAAGATREQAVQMLDAQGWQPGEGGRPMTAQQKAAIAHAKQTHAAAVTAITNPASFLTGGQ